MRLHFLQCSFLPFLSAKSGREVAISGAFSDGVCGVIGSRCPLPTHCDLIRLDFQRRCSRRSRWRAFEQHRNFVRVNHAPCDGKAAVSSFGTSVRADGIPVTSPGGIEALSFVIK